MHGVVSAEFNICLSRQACADCSGTSGILGTARPLESRVSYSSACQPPLWVVLHSNASTATHASIQSLLLGNSLGRNGCIIIPPMAPKPKVLYLRSVPPDLVNKLKAAAALSGGQSIQTYVVQLLLEHVAELERRGQLPKGKGS